MEEHKENRVLRLIKILLDRCKRLIKVLIGGYGAAVGIFIIMKLFDLGFFWGKYEKTLY